MNITIKESIAIATFVLLVLSCISQSLDIKAKLKSPKHMTTKLQTSFLLRNWPMLMVCALGTAGMLSIGLEPLSQSSVLFCVLGGVFTAVAVAGIAMLEMARQLADTVASVLEARG